jgi:hypothetical protein
MNSNPNEREYFINEGVLDLRKLNHDIASALGTAENMIRMAEKNPARRSEYDALLKSAIERLKSIRGSLETEFNRSGL